MDMLKMANKSKRINPILDWLSVVIAFLVMGFIVYSLYSVFDYDKQTKDYNSFVKDNSFFSEPK